jgi:hypothetical protein
MILTLPCLICYRRTNTHVVQQNPEWNATRGGGSKSQMKSDGNEKNVKVRMDRETR